MASKELALARYTWGHDEYNRRQRILDDLSKFPLRTRCRDPYQLSRRALWTLRFEQSVEILELKLRLGWDTEHFLDALKIALPDVSPLNVNYRIFLRNLETQMSPEQQAVWIPKAQNYEISGCYAQTELGHGSNVKGIETTATFDPATDEFILHSPTVSSHKYWIGSLGVIATHALVVARLLIFGKDLGNHIFLVQVRNLDTHDLVPNVMIYEQGQKSLGSFASIDNGAMQLINKRIPRAQMLAGMASVDRNGAYRQGQHTKHSYTSMVIIRGLMIAEIGQDVGKAVIIALKYTAFRRQFNTENGLETPVINYASVKNRLYPALCRAIAMMFFGREVKHQIDNLQDSDPEDIHLQTVGGKIWVTEHGVRDVEMARLSCGGQGNMAHAGLGLIHAQLSPARTYEGDTYILSQQIGKAVVKHWKSNSETSVPALSYVHRLRNSIILSRRVNVKSQAGWLTRSNQEDFLEQRGAFLAKRHIEDTARGNDTSYDVRNLAMAHADLTFWRSLQNKIRNAPEEHRPTFEGLANVFSLTTMLEGLDTFVGTQYLSEKDIFSLRAAHRDSMSAFSSHIESLVDAFGFTEQELNSVFALEHKTPYEALWEIAQQSELSDNTAIRPTLLRARSLWKMHQGSSGQAKI